MRTLTNGQVRIVVGEDADDLQKAFKDFYHELEVDEKTEYHIVSTKPALCVVLTEGVPTYEEVGPRIEEPVTSEYNKQWLFESAAAVALAVKEELARDAANA